MKICDFILTDKAKCKGGMQDNNGNNNNINATNEGDKKHEKEIKTLIRLFGDSINKEELKQKIINNNGNIELVIKELVQFSVENEVYYNNNNNISCLLQLMIKAKAMNWRYRTGNNKIILFYLFYDIFYAFVLK
ncbi:hypothetical protein RFI_00011 [Reticulomyxa filosa]|uniref:Uncharacterized protein n=1 Tax=Reticulomyxa filosa TaxID=46433 RepID=X6PFQ0_RETFI|nr:hypothetical protein RFI_00011 [Reticulomyxa filosa]|eukprot:ETO37051.1 hypothetical protein RFI_00011 [Reticulomyxa filosa]